VATVSLHGHSSPELRAEALVGLAKVRIFNDVPEWLLTSRIIERLFTFLPAEDVGTCAAISLFRLLSRSISHEILSIARSIWVLESSAASPVIVSHCFREHNAKSHDTVEFASVAFGLDQFPHVFSTATKSSDRLVANSHSRRIQIVLD
jgi:hypothetical protein